MFYRKCSVKNLCILILAALQMLFIFHYSRITCSTDKETSNVRQVLVPTANTVVSEYDTNIKQDCFLFVMILSSVDGISRRNAIRETWMRDHRSLAHRVVVKFMIGTLQLTAKQTKSLIEENDQHNDLFLLENVRESFKNLTRKVLYSFIAINERYSFSYLFKGDDDTYIRLDVVSDELSKRNHHSRYYWGFFDGRSKPKKAGKYIETEWFVCDLYVPYALGGGYVISNDIVSAVCVNRNILKLYNSEDASVGLWVSGFDVERSHDARFDTEYKSRGCSNQYIVTHKQSEESMREKYRNLHTLGRLCEVEEQTRLSYRYDWRVPPSQCCKREKGVP